VNAERRHCGRFKEPGAEPLRQDLPPFEEELPLLDKFDLVPDDDDAGQWQSLVEELVVPDLDLVEVLAVVYGLDDESELRVAVAHPRQRETAPGRLWPKDVIRSGCHHLHLLDVETRTDRRCW
jgi:hypothetical protein